MRRRADHVKEAYAAQVIVSPARLGGESKDQDRAAWHAPTSTACVADGVSSAPFSQHGAELATRLGPCLFQGPTSDAMNMLAQRLIGLREEFHGRGVTLPPDAPPALQALLAEAARTKLAKACQTTLIAAHFGVCADGVVVDVVRCGDSAFLAFAPDGTLVGANVPDAPSATNEAVRERPPGSGAFSFGPGAVLVARLLGSVQELPLLVPAEVRHRTSDLVCVAVEVPRIGKPKAGTNSDGTLWLVRGDLLLVPGCLVTRCHDPMFGTYVRVLYSSHIRRLSSPIVPARIVQFAGRGAATAVLPDDVQDGHWVCQRDMFPDMSQFVLASDGLTGCFSDSTELWTWLKTHAQALGEPNAREELLAALHAGRYERIGDDDISFVWIRPATASDGGERFRLEVQDEQ